MDRACCRLDRLHQLICPDFKADQRIWSERLGNWNVRGIAALGDQDTADPRNVVARIEGVPAAAEISLKPAGKIPRGEGRRHPDVTENAGPLSPPNDLAQAERV